MELAAVNGSKVTDEEFNVLVGQIADMMDSYGVETVRDAFEQAEDETQDDLPELQDDLETDDEDDDDEESEAEERG